MPSVERISHELALRVLEVRAVTDLTPSLRRIELTGDLAGFASASPDDHVKLIFPEPGASEPRLPELGTRGLRVPPGETPPPMRDYTPRTFDVAAGRLTVDFVIHGDGPASTWAASATAGARIGQAGPRGSRVASADFDWWLLAGDETALPSIGRRLAELPATAQAIVVCEVAGPGDEIELPSEAEVDLTWVRRGDLEPGRGAGLEQAVRTARLPAGTGFAWVAAEAEVARRLRSHLREERGLPKAFSKATGYWRHGVAAHHDPPEKG